MGLFPEQMADSQVEKFRGRKRPSAVVRNMAYLGNGFVVQLY